ncbi:putative RING-H2 finger protein ATL21A [Alnus glutinosa]|uniref:putative RING-H2 finger protein ATL21A n=1 Tax=Alnus glutinosa TaxID=3517 RepID=UPI002D778AA2|nr:putative RING-H2 finger protein ATL21A [Alnus glutinosa]
MASFQVFLSTFFIFFVLPHITSSAIICKTSSCGGRENLLVNFPFRLKDMKLTNRAAIRDSISHATTKARQSLLSLIPVTSLSNTSTTTSKQAIYIDDPDHCFARRFLQNFTLSGSPFQFAAVGNFTFLNCSANKTTVYEYGYGRVIPCVSGNDYNMNTENLWAWGAIRHAPSFLVALSLLISPITSLL